MKISPQDIVRAAVDAAAEEFKKQGMLDELPRLGRHFREVLSERDGAILAVLITPTGDAGALRDTIAQMLEKRLGRVVELVQKADPSIIGGAILTIGDDRIDMSIKGELEQLENDLRKIPMHAQK